MGNKVAKDFYELELGQGSISKKNMLRSAVVPDAVVLDSPRGIVVQLDHMKRIQYFDMVTKQRLFVTTFTKGPALESVTKDGKGNLLYITKSCNCMKRIIFKSSESHEGDDESESWMDEVDGHSLYPVAMIEIDTVGVNRTAILSIKLSRKEKSNSDDSNSASSGPSKGSKNTKGSKGSKQTKNTADSTTTGKSETSESEEYVDVYKATQIPNVKFGAVVIDMKGQVVGKSSFEANSQFPNILVAPRTDSAAITALACVVNGEL